MIHKAIYYNFFFVLVQLIFCISIFGRPGYPPVDDCNELMLKINKSDLLLDNKRSDALNIALEVLDEAGILHCNEAKINALLNIGYIKYYGGESDKSLLLYEQAINLAEAINYSSGYIKGCNRMARAYVGRGMFENSLDYLNKAAKIAEIQNDDHGRSLTLYGMGNYYMIQAMYTEAMRSYKSALKISESINFLQNVIDCNIGLGLILKENYHFDDAVEHFLLALKLAKENDDIYSMAFIYRNLGEIEYFRDNYQPALEYVYEGIFLEEELNNTVGLAVSLTQLGNIMQAMGNPDQAIDFFYQAMKHYEVNNEKSGIANSLFNIGQNLFYKNDCMKARDYYLQSLELAKSLNIGMLMKDNYQALVSISFILNEYDDAYKYLHAYSAIRKSMILEEEFDNLSKNDDTQEDSRFNYLSTRILKTSNLLIGSVVINLVLAGLLFYRSRKRVDKLWRQDEI